MPPRPNGCVGRKTATHPTTTDRSPSSSGSSSPVAASGCANRRGRVLELAAGTARNLTHYPSDVTLTGVDLSPEMLAIGHRRAAELAREADLRLGDAQALEFPDDTFDTVVCTLGLCTIPNPGRAVAEAWRVLRPGGQILLLEHVRSPLLPVRVLQQLLEPLSVRFAADHLTREPLDYLITEGFEVERLERSKWGIVERISARKPERSTITPGA